MYETWSPSLFFLTHERDKRHEPRNSKLSPNPERIFLFYVVTRHGHLIMGYRKTRGNKHGLKWINMLAYKFLFWFFYKEQVSLSLDLGSDKNKQETKWTLAGRWTHGEHGAHQTHGVSPVTSHPSYSSLPCSAECVVCTGDIELQQGVCRMGRRCQDGHWGRKSEFRGRKFPGLLPWGPEQKCRAMKRSITQTQVQVPLAPNPWAGTEQTRDRLWHSCAKSHLPDRVSESSKPSLGACSVSTV